MSPESYSVATGVIEGACRHANKDRRDLTGARWTLVTEAVLKLGALRSSGGFDEYWEFREEMERTRNYQSRVRAIIPKKPGIRLVEKSSRCHPTELGPQKPCR
jgi:hypothetical protein